MPTFRPGVDPLVSRIDTLAARYGDRSPVLEAVRRAYEAYRASQREEAVARATLEAAVTGVELGCVVTQHVAVYVPRNGSTS